MRDICGIFYPARSQAPESVVLANKDPHQSSMNKKLIRCPPPQLKLLISFAISVVCLLTAATVAIGDQESSTSQAGIITITETSSNLQSANGSANSNSESDYNYSQLTAQQVSPYHSTHPPQLRPTRLSSTSTKHSTTPTRQHQRQQNSNPNQPDNVQPSGTSQRRASNKGQATRSNQKQQQKQTTRQQAQSSKQASSHQQISSTSSLYNNVPPLWLIETRNLIVDVARQKPGDLLLTVQAHDPDGDQIRYWLEQEYVNDAFSYFSIDPNSGDINYSKEFIYHHEQSSPTGNNQPSKLSNQTGTNSTPPTDDSSPLTESVTRSVVEEGVGDQNSEDHAFLDTLRNVYFLNVGATDGHYPIYIELQITVVNSLLHPSRLPTNPLASDLIEQILGKRTRTFYNQLMQQIKQQQTINNNQTTTSGNSLVYPDYANPSLLSMTPSVDLSSALMSQSSNYNNYTGFGPSDMSSFLLDSKRQFQADGSSSGQLLMAVNPAANLVSAPSTPTGERLSSSGLLSSGSNTIPNSQMGVVNADQLMASVLIFSSLVIIMLGFVALSSYLSHRRTNDRVKHIERQQHIEQHHLSSHKDLSSSATLCSSSARSAISGGPTSSACSLATQSMMNPFSTCSQLSQFTTSYAPNYQASGPLPFNHSHHKFQRNQQQFMVNPTNPLGNQFPIIMPSNHTDHHQQQQSNITNPVYLRDQTNISSSIVYAPSLTAGNVDSCHVLDPSTIRQHEHTTRQQLMMPPCQAMGPFPPAPTQTSHSRTTMGNQDPDHPNNNLYYPLDAEDFYSTINTDHLIQNQQPIGLPLNGSGSQHELSLITNSFLHHHQQQPDFELDLTTRLRDIKSPDGSQSSSSSIRSLARFLSLPNRHHGTAGSQANPLMDKDQETYNRDASLTDHHLLPHSSQNKMMNLNQHNKQAQTSCLQPPPRTIARGSHLDREMISLHDPNHKNWELERHKLIPIKLLDEGEFGQVWSYKLEPSQPNKQRAHPTLWLNKQSSQDATPNGNRAQIVAVKSLKSSAARNQRSREDLLAEIELMKLVCHHPNVVKILYCCTSDSFGPEGKPILLVMEYAELGKLQSFMKKSRQNHQYCTTSIMMTNESNQGSLLGAADNRSQSRSNDIDDNDNHNLTSRDLLKFIYHVAKGMEYIASNSIVHRDLASRNILVSGDRICRIGDFGMARNMKQSNTGGVYERRSDNTKIPVRWMAPEVLLKNTFTTKSDVFSFGILMWEIVTLGSTPYHHLETKQVIKAVAEKGERPAKPEYCHDILYRLMSRCWQHEPQLRPTFRELVRSLDELLLSANDYIELDQYPDHNYYNIPTTAAPFELL